MPEPIFVAIAGMVACKGIITFRAMIVGQFEGDTFHRPQVIVGFLGSRRQVVGFALGERRQKIERKLELWKIELVNQRETQEFRVKFERWLGIFDAQHGLLPSWSAGNHRGGRHGEAGACGVVSSADRIRLEGLFAVKL